MKKEINNNGKGFTLIELLAVVIILGVLMLIAVPSVTEYIAISRKKTYVATANGYVDAAMLKVNSLEYLFMDTNTTYYIPAECINLEKGGKSPYGDWVDAYVVVEFTGDNYIYYWTSVDSAHMGVVLTPINDLTTDSIVSNVSGIEIKGINGDSKTGVVDKTNCSAHVAKSKVESEKEPELPITATPTNDLCFAFDSGTGTISNYYLYEGGNANTSKPACSRDVVIPLSIGGITVTNIARGAFQNKSLSSATFLNGPTNINIANGGYDAGNGVFTGNPAMTTVTIGSSVKSIGRNAFSSPFGGGANQITNLNLANGLQTIGENAFAYNKLQGKLTIPKTVTTIDKGAFIGSYNGSTGATLNKIAELVFAPNSQLQTIGENAFAYNNLHGTITIPKSVRTIDGYAFASVGSSNYINKIEALIFESGSGLQKIGTYAFYLNDIKELTIPATVTLIDEWAFRDNKIETLTFAPGSQLQTVGVYAFGHNRLTGTLTIPASVTSIGNFAFDGTIYSQLTSLVFAPGSKIQTIGQYSFRTNKLTGTLTIPKTVTLIGKNAFEGDDTYNRLTNVVIEAGRTEPLTIEPGAFLSNTITSIINPTGTAFGWCKYPTLGIVSSSCSPSDVAFATGTFTTNGRTVVVKAN